MFDGFSTQSPLDAFLFLGYLYKFLDTVPLAHRTCDFAKEGTMWKAEIIVSYNSNNNNKSPKDLFSNLIGLLYGTGAKN